VGSKRKVLQHLSLGVTAKLVRMPHSDDKDNG
jgi:hypothetical protein